MFRGVIMGEKGSTGGSEKASGVFPALPGSKGLKGTCGTACRDALVCGLHPCS